MQRLIEQLSSFYAGLGSKERGIFTAAVLASLIALAGTFYWASQDTWKTVYTSSNAADVAAAALVLEEKKIPYRVSADGLHLQTTPLNLGRARIESASAGAVSGFESLDDIKLGTSPQRERWAYQHALQGELVRTINALDEVQATRVHLVLPERSAFLREDRPASASVTVQLVPGKTLKKDQVRGIAALIGGAVDGLDAEAVVLVDDSGRLLSGQTGNDDVMGLPGLFEAQQAYEGRYRKAVLQSLSPILGSANAISVAVTVDLDPTMIESTVMELDPDTQVTISEEIREDNSEDQSAGGIPGTASNLPETPAIRKGNNKRSTSELSTNYDYTTTQRHTVQRAGRIEKVSVAVMVNADSLAALVEAAGEGADADALKKQIEETVRVAIGYDEARGDSIAVTFIPFSVQVLDDSELIGDTWNPVDFAPYLVALVSLVLFFAFVILPVMRAITTGGSVGGARGDVIARAANRFGGGGSSSQDEEGLNLAERLRMLVDNFEPVEAQDLNRLVELQEDASAQVLRRWIQT